MKRVIALISTLLLFAACSKKEQVSHVAVMIGSESSGFEDAETFSKISEGISVGISGEDWGGEIVSAADGNEFNRADSGGHVILISPESKLIEIKGETENDIYVIILYQHFYQWPDKYDGAVLHKIKLDAGQIDYSVDISHLTEKAKAILMD